MRRPATLGVPIDCVGEAGGTELMPRALRGAGIVTALGASDAGDVPVAIRGRERDPASGVLALPTVMSTIVGVRTAVAAQLRAEALPLLLAGDCTATIGACAAAHAEHGRVGLIYIDGHLDLYDGRTSPTGESADFPLAVVCGHGPPELREAAYPTAPVVDPADVALLGPRDRDEAVALGSLMPEDLDPAPLCLEADRVREIGPAEAGRLGVDRAGAATAGFWVHLDLDVLDESEFPATDYLLSGGLEWQELADMAAPGIASERCLGITVACYNPEKDPTGEYAERVVRLLATLLDA